MLSISVYAIFYVFVIRGISLVDTKTEIFVTNRYRSNSIVFQDVFKFRTIWAKIRAKLIIQITTLKKVFSYLSKFTGCHRKGDSFAKTR